MNRNMAAIMWAMEARGLTPTAWRVLAMLARRVNSYRSDWDVWPSQPELAERCEVSISTLRRHLDELEKKRFIERDQLFRDNGAKSSCRYRLLVSVTIAMPDGEATGWDGYEGGTVQSEWRAPVSPDGRAPVTGEGCREPLKEGTSERKNPSFNGSVDLLGHAADDGWLTDDLLADLYIAKWNALIDRCPRLKPIQAFGGEKRKELRARVREHAKPCRAENVNAFLDGMFDVIAGSKWLSGEGTEGWAPAAAWPVMRKNCTKIMEGFYVQDRRGGATGNAGGGSANLEAGLAARDALHARFGTAGNGQGRPAQGRP
jgi:DNA-binding MarR family transcriptional regulator